MGIIEIIRKQRNTNKNRVQNKGFLVEKTVFYLSVVQTQLKRN